MDTTHPVTTPVSPHEGRRTSMAPRVFLAHPSGNQFFRHLAVALRDAGLLERAFTCIDWRGGFGLDRFLPGGLRAELSRRSFSRDLGIPIRRHSWRETGRLAAGRCGLRRLTAHETGVFSVDAVYQDFDRWVAANLDRASAGNIVYAYEDAADATFARAAQEGWRCVYDLPIAYWETSRRLLDEEAQRLPEWEPTLVGTRDSPEKLERKSRELAAADLVVCPSRFVADSLPADAGHARRVVVAPFGSPPAQPRKTERTSGPLRVLFAGGLTQRKGLADLFAAVQLLERRDVELVVMGTPVTDPAFYRRQGEFTYESPRPHGAVLALMRQCDVLCLPSIVEGRALVVQEAMSAGLPVIITPNTGADDVVEDGKNGFVVPVRSPQSIAAKIAWFADHRDALLEFGAAAAGSIEMYSWRRYGQTIVQAIDCL